MSNFISRTITGILVIALGIFLIAIAIIHDIWVLLYGIPIFLIGFFILFNKKEDKIEEIKNSKEKDL